MCHYKKLLSATYLPVELNQIAAIAFMAASFSERRYQMVFGKNLYFNNHYLSEFDLQLASIKSSGLEDKDIGLELDVTTLNTGKNPCSHLV